MVYCVIVCCGNKGVKDKTKSFFCLPAVKSDQGETTFQLSERRRRNWLTAIGRADLTSECLLYVRVCSDHFIKGKPASLYDDCHPDWVPSLKLGHGATSI